MRDLLSEQFWWETRLGQVCFISKARSFQAVKKRFTNLGNIKGKEPFTKRIENKKDSLTSL